jgi:hypothetical protein
MFWILLFQLSLSQVWMFNEIEGSKLYMMLSTNVDLDLLQIPIVLHLMQFYVCRQGRLWCRIKRQKLIMKKIQTLMLIMKHRQPRLKLVTITQLLQRNWRKVIPFTLFYLINQYIIVLQHSQMAGIIHFWQGRWFWVGIGINECLHIEARTFFTPYSLTHPLLLHIFIWLYNQKWLCCLVRIKRVFQNLACI